MRSRLNTGEDKASSLKYFSNYFEWLDEAITNAYEFKKNMSIKIKEIPPKSDNDVKRYAY